MPPWIATATTTGAIYYHTGAWVTAGATATGTIWWSDNSNQLNEWRARAYRPIASPAAPVYRAPRPAIIRERTPEEVVEREAASARARGLLIGELSRAQRRQFEAEGSFEVRGRRGVYRIRRAVAGNIDVLRPEGGIAHRLCGHPSDLSMPVEDVMLAQLIHLRHDEDGFLRIANRHAAPGIPWADANLAMAERLLRAEADHHDRMAA